MKQVVWRKGKKKEKIFHLHQIQRPCIHSVDVSFWLTKFAKPLSIFSSWAWFILTVCGHFLPKGLLLLIMESKTEVAVDKLWNGDVSACGTEVCRREGESCYKAALRTPAAHNQLPKLTSVFVTPTESAFKCQYVSQVYLKYLLF